MLFYSAIPSICRSQYAGVQLHAWHALLISGAPYGDSIAFSSVKWRYPTQWSEKSIQILSPLFITIGSDIDDCFALSYLLCHPEVELMGISTVSGFPHLRGQVADKICTIHFSSVLLAVMLLFFVAPYCDKRCGNLNFAQISTRLHFDNPPYFHAFLSVRLTQS